MTFIEIKNGKPMTEHNFYCEPNILLKIFDTANFYSIRDNLIDSITIEYINEMKISYSFHFVDKLLFKEIILRQLFLNKEMQYEQKMVNIDTLSHGTFTLDNVSYDNINTLYKNMTINKKIINVV